MRMRDWARFIFLIGAAAGAVALQVTTHAEIHNGGVDCTNWNGLYNLAGASANDRSLTPPDQDTIDIKQTDCHSVTMTATLKGQRVELDVKMAGSSKRQTVTIGGRSYDVYGSWVDGYGQNWIIKLTPDPVRPSVPYSLHEYLLTSFHSIISQDTIHDFHNMVPLATFDREGRGGKTKVNDIVDGRAVYLLPVDSSGSRGR
jgi:hypothetical protein